MKSAADDLRKFMGDQKAQARNDLKSVASTSAGQRFLYELLVRSCGMNTRVSPGPEGLIQEGRRRVAIELDELLRRHCSNEHIQLMTDGLRVDQQEEFLKREAEDTRNTTDEEESL